MSIPAGLPVSGAEAGRAVGAVFGRVLHDGVSDMPLQDMLVEIAQGRITGLRPATAEGARQAGALMADVVAPGFIDLQINGANDTQFNFDPSVAALERIAAGARRGGTAHLLPTFITAPGQDYRRAMSAVAEAIAQGVPGILGLHLEGPFLSPARPGIHDPAAIRRMEADDLAALTAPFPGKLLLTVAPEELPPGYLAALVKAGVIVFAGHSAGSAEQITLAAAQGLRGATHLFNAMSQMTGREPGVVGAVLGSDSLFAGIIADGHHVDATNLRIAARLMPDRLCLVTDAMLTLAGTQDRFMLNGAEIRLEAGRLANAEGRLAGAHIAMDACLRHMQSAAGVSAGHALRMASTNPARALGCADGLGTLRPGGRAALSLLDRDLHSIGVVLDGVAYPA